MAIVITALPLLTALAAEPSLDNFLVEREYEDQFADVKSTDWFYNEVKLSYEIGLVNGMSATSYGPGSNVTLAEIIALASRLHSIYNTGEASFEQGETWYQVYVDYAEENDFLLPDLDDYNRAALRSEVAAILAKSLPASALEEINTVEDNAVPDVKIDAPHAAEIYELYRAGVLTGNDSSGIFYPNNPIRRSEIAAIVSRMAIPDARKNITLEVQITELIFASFITDPGSGKFEIAILGVNMLFSGKIDTVGAGDITDLVVTRNGQPVEDHSLILDAVPKYDDWGHGVYTDFDFMFAKEYTEPGRYSLSLKYLGEAFSISLDTYIEASLSDVPANPDALQEVDLRLYYDESGPTAVRSIYFVFEGIQQSFSISDLTDLELTCDGVEIDFALKDYWYRFVLENLEGDFDTYYGIDFDEMLTESGEYELTGKYRGKAFISDMFESVP